ncbi:YchF/TatD family DNA exonuclease [Candidatus Dependentiae bacterium]|nr:YchF/TatD family DNA exonuclease [Candidatus Dependentiae bacterium]
MLRFFKKGTYMYIDTHCHLNMLVDKQPNQILNPNDFLIIKQIIDSARKVDVKQLITIGTSTDESLNSINIAKKNHNVFCAVGLHPCDCGINWQKDFEKIKQMIQNKKENKIVAIGETGLDFFHMPFDKGRQIYALRSHIELSIEHQLPIIIHVRDAAKDLLRVLKDYKNKIKGVVHCFSQDLNFAKAILELKLFLGIGAIITYPKNDSLRTTINQIPIENILLETDSPFLPPQNLRGKQNLPEYIPIIAEKLAEIKNTSTSKIEKITTLNAQKLFKI